MPGGTGINYHDYISKLRNQSPKPSVTDGFKSKPPIPRVQSAPQLSLGISYFEYIQQIQTSKSEGNLKNKEFEKN